MEKIFSVKETTGTDRIAARFTAGLWSAQTREAAMRDAVYRLQYFIRNDAGELSAGHVEQARNAADAVSKASLLSRLKPGVVAFRRSIEITGDYGPPVKLAEFGDVPEDISAY